MKHLTLISSACLLLAACNSDGVTHPRRTNPPPIAPSNLTAQPKSTTSILLAWQDLSDNETSFVLESRLANSSTWAVVTSSISANSTEFSHDSLQPNTEYWYRISAAHDSVASTPSNEVVTRTLDPACSEPPHIVQVSLQGEGNVKSSDQSIDCGLGKTICSASYSGCATGTITLSATPDPVYEFSRWDGCTLVGHTTGSNIPQTCVVSIEQDASVTALFYSPEDLVRLDVITTKTIVYSEDGKIQCGDPEPTSCVGFYEPGTIVRLSGNDVSWLGCDELLVGCGCPPPGIPGSCGCSYTCFVTLRDPREPRKVEVTR